MPKLPAMVSGFHGGAGSNKLWLLMEAVDAISGRVLSNEDRVFANVKV